MMNTIKRENRRRGPDSMVKAIRIFSAIAWILVIVIFFLVTYGKPRLGMTYFSNNDKTLVAFAIALLGVVLFICFIGILVNMNRHKRKSDKYNKSLIFFSVVSLLGILYYFLFA